MNRGLRRHFLDMCRGAGFPEPVFEYRFHEPLPGEKKRQWRFDAAWPHHLLAVEYEGGLYSRGRHVRSRGFAEDCKKYNWATVNGWDVLRYPTAELMKIQTISDISRILNR